MLSAGYGGEIINQFLFAGFGQPINGLLKRMCCCSNTSYNVTQLLTHRSGTNKDRAD